MGLCAACGRAPITIEDGGGESGGTADGGGAERGDAAGGSRPGSDDDGGRPGGPRPDAGSMGDGGGDPGPVMGGNPAGGNTVARWLDDGLEVEMSNLTLLTCEDNPLPMCGTPDEAAWNVRFLIPRELVGVGEFFGEDLEWFAGVAGPLEENGSCYGGFGAFPNETVVTISYLDDDVVKGDIKGLVPDPTGDLVYSGAYWADICPR